MEKRKAKRKKFHDALLSLYHPLPPPPPPPQLDGKPLAVVHGGMNFEFDPGNADEVEKESSLSDASDCVPQKLTRAQRKRLRKRKQKEAASVRRKIIGPLLPSSYQDSKDEHSNDKMKPFQEKD